MKVIAVIPARYGATRLPGKPLVDICGKPMIQWVYERTCQARGIDHVIVATDDERIFHAVTRFGGKAHMAHVGSNVAPHASPIPHVPYVMMTSANLTSGTDRVAAVADEVPADIYVNVQGDEPMMEPAAIEAAVELVRNGRFTMATVMTPIKDSGDLTNPAIVKVLADRNERAIYFSRFAIPYSRKAVPKITSGEASEPIACRRHVGLYAYTRDTLFRIRNLTPSLIEQGESLEQLRAMEDGIAIGITEIDFTSIGVDTPDELEKVRRALGRSK